MGYLILVILLLAFSWLVYKDFLRTGLSKFDLLASWGIKLSYAVVFMYIMSFHFSQSGSPIGDVGNFLHDGKELYQYAQKDPAGYAQLLVGLNSDNPDVLSTHLKDTRIWDYGITSDNINDNRLIIRLNSVIRFFSFGNYWVHVLMFAFLSFIGSLLIYRSFEDFVNAKRMFLLGLVALPTVGFWGAGITKEALLILGFGVFVFGVHQLFHKINHRNIILILIGVWLMIFNKPHVGLVVIPMIAFVFIAKNRNFGLKAIAVSTGVILAGFVVLCFTPERANIVSRVSSKQQDFINVAKGGIFFINDSSFCAFDYDHLSHFEYDAEQKLIAATKQTEGDYKLFGEKVFHPFTIEPSSRKYDVYLVIPPSETYVDVEPIANSGSQLIKNVPAALFNVMIRPLPTDGGSNFKFISFAENLIFIGILGIVFFQRKKLESEERSWVFYLIASACILILIIGWTTPVIGAVVRYKMAAYLLLLLAAFIIWKGPKKSTT